jgi:hypothetical protein
MTWAQRLKRVFNIDVSTCGHCGGAVRIVARIEEPTAIREKWPRTARRRAPAMPKSDSRTSDPRPHRRLRDLRLLARLFEKGV